MNAKEHTIKGVIVFDVDSKRYIFTDYPRAEKFENGAYKSDYLHYVLVREHEITFTIPADFDIIKPQLAALDKQETDLRAKFQQSLQHIQTQRNNLLAIDYTPAPDYGDVTDII